jgi:excinuclease ABC subunit C
MPNLTQKIKSLPQKPGVYKFLDKNGKVLYIGKAKNLRARVRQYFGKADERPQIPFLLKELKDLDVTITATELESLYLENSLIKQYMPKYNIDLKDDKNFIFLKLDYSTEIPQFTYVRTINDSPIVRPPFNSPLARGEGRGREIPQFTFARKVEAGQRSNAKGQRSKFFGPYSAVYKIRNTLHFIRKIFPYCSAEKISNRPCFYYHLHRCPGVCVGKITLNEYKKHLEKIELFLSGKTAKIKKELKTEMIEASKQKKFEKAARLRDQLKSLEILEQKQIVILNKKVDWDIISTFNDNSLSCVNLFKIRGGKLMDKENFVYKFNTDLRMLSGSTDTYGYQIIQTFLENYYSQTSYAPKTIYLEHQISNTDLISRLIQSRFGKKIKILIPQKGKAKQLVKLGQTNAEEYLKNYSASQAQNLDKIQNALLGLKDVLNLPRIPKRIEGYDISNLQGTNPVGSMVVFENGAPKKSEYRKFKIKTKDTPDDFAMMKEMLSRRFSRSVIVRSAANEAISREGLPRPSAALEPRNDNRWPLPDLIVIDGGKGQLNAAVAAISNFKFQISKQIPIIGLAKKLEEIFVPKKSEPIILSHDNPALQLLQRLRDEAHRFGITFHRNLRSKQAVKSALDEIAGVGPKTKKKLKEKFGTVAEIKAAPAQELENLIGKKLAEKIKNLL